MEEKRVRLARLQDLADTVGIADDELSLWQWARFCHPTDTKTQSNLATVERVRLATLQDLADMVGIADDELSLSQWDRFCHPRATEFPVESRRQTSNQLLKYLMDDGAVFTVAELLEDNRWKVVGFATWKLAEGQAARQFPPQENELLWLPVKKRYWWDNRRSKLMDDARHEAREKYFRGCMMLDGLIVDPDYRDRGFGNRLCTHGLQIAMWDKVSVGVVATDEGSKMYSSLGFESRERFQLVDAAPWKEATLEFHAMRWDLAVEEA